ncbi:DUF6894 family protein [Sphingomonas sp. ATCC 31555]|nr:hypothetical protein [Sphingomonas sp. ATCC 31555]
MPNYHFCFRTPNNIDHLSEQHDLPDLRRALIAAHQVGRTLLHNQVRRAPIALHGTLDIEDEDHQPVARILLADLVRQIS